MKLKHTVAAVTALCTLLLGADEVKTLTKNGTPHEMNTHSMRINLLFSNDSNAYELRLGTKKPVGDKPPQTVFFNENTKAANFSPLVRWMKITVNGIELRKIPLKKEDVKPWADKDRKGFETVLNFDGAKLLLRFWMRPDSGVLWGELLPAPDSLEEIKSVSVDVCCIPSLLARENKKVLFHKAYSREVKTPAKVYKPYPQGQNISAADTYFVFSDTKFDGSADDKGIGPCMFIADPASFLSGKVHVNTSWTAWLQYQLKPDFKSFRFGFWEQKSKRISNTEFFRMLEEKPEAFSL